MKPAVDYTRHSGQVGAACSNDSNNVAKRDYKSKSDRGPRFNSSVSTSPCSMQTSACGSQKMNIEAYKYCQCHYAVDLGGEYFKEFLRKCKFGVEVEYKSLQPTNKKTTDYPQVCHKIACMQTSKSNATPPVHQNTHGATKRHGSSSGGSSSINGSGTSTSLNFNMFSHHHNRHVQVSLGHEKNRVNGKALDSSQRHGNNKGAAALLWNYSDAFPELGAKAPQKTSVNVSNYYAQGEGDKLQESRQQTRDKVCQEYNLVDGGDKTCEVKELVKHKENEKMEIPAGAEPLKVQELLKCEIETEGLVKDEKSTMDEMANECSTASTINETFRDLDTSVERNVVVVVDGSGGSCGVDGGGVDDDDDDVVVVGSGVVSTCGVASNIGAGAAAGAASSSRFSSSQTATATATATLPSQTATATAILPSQTATTPLLSPTDPQLRCKDCKFNLVIPRLESFMNGDGTSGAPLICYACRARRRQPLCDSAEMLIRNNGIEGGNILIDCFEHLSNASDETLMLLRCSNVQGYNGNTRGAPRACPFVDFRRNGTVSSMEGLEASCIMCNKPPLAVAISPALSGDAAPKLQDALTQNALDESKGSRLVACTEKCTLNVLRGVVKSITPSAASIQKKLYLYKTMERLLKYSLGEDTQVCMAGSTSYDIDIEYGENYNGTTCYSDLDIEILSGRYAFNARAILTRVYHDMCTMQRLASENRLYNNWVLGNSKIKLVSTAKVPIVILSTPSGLICDVSVNVTNSLVHRDLFTLLINKHPNLRPFMRIIKHWIKLRGIPPMKRGGFPSVFWMVIFCNIVDCLEQDALDATLPPCVGGGAGAGGGKATWSATDNAMLRWLEAGFNLLCDGATLAEMVQVYSGLVSLDSFASPKWKMGAFGRDFVNLIEMDNSQPLGVWLVYYYELKRACKLLAEYRQHLQVLRLLENLLMQVDGRSNASFKGDVDAVRGCDTVLACDAIRGCDAIRACEAKRSFSKEISNVVDTATHTDTGIDNDSILCNGITSSVNDLVSSESGAANDVKGVNASNACNASKNVNASNDVKNENMSKCPFMHNGNTCNDTDTNQVGTTHYANFKESSNVQVLRPANDHEEEIQKLAQRYKLRLSGSVIDRLYMLVCHVIQVAIATVLRIFEESNDRIYSIPAAVEPPLQLEYVINGLGQYPCACKLPDACRNLLNYMWLDSGWFIALVQEELAIIKVIKTCIHWDSWWSLDFTSRRDSRSVFHALVHKVCQVGNVAVLARQGGVVLLNPSHIVSGLYVARLDRPREHFGNYLKCLDPNTGRECVYLVPKYELARINEFETLAHTLAATLEASACKGYPNNKWIPTCCHCGAPDCYVGNLQVQEHLQQLQLQSPINDPALEAILEAMQRALVRQPAI